MSARGMENRNRQFHPHICMEFGGLDSPGSGHQRERVLDKQYLSKPFSNVSISKSKCIDMIFFLTRVIGLFIYVNDVSFSISVNFEVLLQII